MHIAIVIHDFALGGAERIALRLAGAWHAAGERVTIVSGAADGDLRPLVAPGIAVIAPEPAIVRGMTRRALARYASRVLPPLAPDVVLLPGNYYFGLAAPIRRRLPHARIVGKISNAMVRFGESCLRGALRRALLQHKAKSLHALAIYDHATRQEVEHRLRVSSDHCHVVGHPVFEKPPEIPRVRAPLNHLAAAGRLVAQKDFALAIETLLHLPDKFKISIYGIGPLHDELLALIENLGLEDRVRLEGYVDDLTRVLPQFGIFALTSQYEGFGTVVLEALGQGLPVISTACAPVLRHVLHDRDLGEVVETRDARELAAAIMRQAEMAHRDPKKFEAVTRQYTLPEVSQRFLALFSSLLDRPAAGAR